MAVPDLYQEPAPLVLVQGIVANSVSSPGQALYVVIPSYDGVTQWGPLPWTPHGTSYPTRGATCLVGADENGVKRVVQWDGPYTLPSGVSLPVIQVATPSGDTTGATDATAIDTAEATLGGAPGVLQFQRGHYYDNKQRNHDGSVAVKWKGTSGNTPGAAAGTVLTYVGSAAPYVSARSSYGFTVEDMQILYSNSGLTGLFFDFSHSGAATDSSYFLFERCAIGGAGIRTATLFGLDKAIIGTFRDVNFSNGLYAVQGAATAGSYSNAIGFEGNCSFNNFVNPPILNPVQGWGFFGATFENLYGGAAGAIASSMGGCSGLIVAGGWMGDATAGSGYWIDLPISGSSITGVYAGGGHVFANLHASSAGVAVKGNSLVTMDTAIAVGTGCSNLDLIPNFYSGVTTQISFAGSLPTGSLYSDSAGRLNSSLLWARGGVATITADTTGISTSAGIDALIPETPLDGLVLIDPVNKLVFARAGGKWGKTAALTMLP